MEMKKGSWSQTTRKATNEEIQELPFNRQIALSFTFFEELMVYKRLNGFIPFRKVFKYFKDVDLIRFQNSPLAELTDEYSQVSLRTLF